MTHPEISAPETDDFRRAGPPLRPNPLRPDFDAEVHLPADISRDFLAAALLHAIEKKVEFGIFHETNRIVISYFGGDEDHLPSRWSDKRWRIGREDIDPPFFPDDYV